jgi:ornithine cyclodeaminase/alanine dehydrogenase
MSVVLVLTRDEIASLLTMRDTIEVVEAAFRELADGRVVMPVRPTLRVADPPGLVNVMPAYLAGANAIGLKLVSSYPRNPATFGIPSVQATILYSDVRNGQLLAIMEAGAITAIRTGAASGVATKYLARPDSSVVGILGSGVQAATQLEAVCTVRSIKTARVYSPTRAHRTAYAETMTSHLHVDVVPVDTAEEAVTRADIIVAATAAREPVLRGAWLAPGTHVNGIGTHTPDTRELDETVIARSKVVVDDREAALREAGDLLIPIAAKLISQDPIYAALGEIITGRKVGRTNNDEITLFKSQGLAMQDVATAKLVYDRARSRGVGTEVEL